MWECDEAPQDDEDKELEFHLCQRDLLQDALDANYRKGW